MHATDHISRWDWKLPERPREAGTIAGLLQRNVGVFLVDLDVDAERISALRSCLSTDEIARSERFRHGADGDRYVAARGSLRLLLGQELNTSASEVRIAYTEDKKPFLVGDSELSFNVSHSGGLALIALAHGIAVGVDIELLRNDFNPLALAKRFFSSQECGEITAADEPMRHRAFLTYWTCKEAYLKAIGSGLRVPLNRFTVDPGAGTITREAESQPTTHQLVSFEPLPGAIAALALDLQLQNPSETEPGSQAV